MYSFYGGKEGRTYNLVAHYDSIHDMVLNFQKGGSYNDANYNEYVIIDTFVNRNEKYNRENGIIYRRGLNYSEEFDPNQVTDAVTHTIDEDAVITGVVLRGENGKLYQDTDEVPVEEQILQIDASVPKYKHYEYILTQEPGEEVQVELHAKDWKFAVEDRITVTLQGEANVTYTDENPGTSGLSVTVAVPKYYHYSYYLHNENLGVQASIGLGREYTLEEVKEKYGETTLNRTLFQEDWAKFVTNPGGGAVYVGQIVGPQGGSTEITMTDWETFEDVYLHGGGSGSGKGEIRALRRPGFEEGVRYNDDIKYGWATIKDIQGNIDHAVLALDIPYTVFKYRADSVSAYGPVVHEVEELPTQRPTTVTDYYYVIGEDAYYIWDDSRTVDPTIITVTELPEDGIDTEAYYFLNVYDLELRGTYQYNIAIEQWDKVDVPEYVTRPGFVHTDIWAVARDENGWHYFDILRERAVSQGHLYYKDYEIKIPRGIHGKDVENLIIDSDYEVSYDEINYDILDPSKSIAEQEQGVTTNHHIATLKVIKDTELVQQRDGQAVSFIKITYYTYDTEQPYVIYVTELPEENIELDAYYYLDVEDIEQRGYYKYNTLTQQWDSVAEPQGQKIYHTQDLPIKRVNRFELTNTGRIVVHYLNGTSASTETLTGALRSITNIALNEYGQMVITYNTVNAQGRQDQTVINYQLKIIEEFGITNDKKLDATKQFYFKYDRPDPGQSEPVPQIFTEKLNDVVDVKLYGDNIIILYSDPSRRQSIPASQRYELPYTPRDDTDWNYTEGDVAGTKLLYWENLGPVLVGQHVFGHFPDYETLEEQYPYGFEKDTQGQPVPEREKYAGWVASVVEYDTQTPPQIIASSIYAYDYIGTRGWYEISQLDVQGLDPRKVMIISEPDQQEGERPEQLDSILVENGYWFVTEDVVVAKD